MREVTFLKNNAEKWKQFESYLSKTKDYSSDQLAELFIQLTDDLAYSKTFYPKSKTTLYLNSLASKVHQHIYRNKKEEKGKFIYFWSMELPALFYKHRKELLISFSIFIMALIIGIFSAANNDSFVRLILGDSYVNMTSENISKGDPMAVYKQMNQVDMFLGITFNNIRVSFYAFILGIFFSFGTAYILFSNGIMLGAFEYFFFIKGFLIQSLLAIWLHGTLEISAIIIAGSAGITIGNSILFPGTFSRRQSILSGAQDGVRIVIGLIPVFIAAGFLESFLTRYTEMPLILNLFIIFGSFTFIIWYVIILPSKQFKRGVNHGYNTEN